MSSLPVSTLSGADLQDELRRTAGRRMAGRSTDVEDYNKTSQTAEAWQKKLIQKHPVKITGTEGEGRITMIRHPLIFSIMNAASSALSIGKKPVWIVGISIKWVPSCDLATSGTLKLSLHNRAVINPVLRDHTVVQMTQRVSTPFEVQYSSSSKHTGGSGNPWSYSYEIEGMDDAPTDMEIGTAVVMPMIRVDEKASQTYSGVSCSVYGGYFPLNLPLVSYCAPGPRFKTNIREISKNIECLKRYLNVLGFTDIDDDLVFSVIQNCDPDTARVITSGINNKVWSPFGQDDGKKQLVESIIYDCRSGRVVPYSSWTDVKTMSVRGGDKKHVYN
uniref:Movement protein n=1 Tax=Vinca chlorotic spot virus TaxID=3076770 RepID=A0AA96HD58_9RHAB|nr:movement protein [Vinca chlorotic spot virus]